MEPSANQDQKQLYLKHYAQPHVIQAILQVSQDKEVVGSYGGKGYAKRPDTLKYKNDIINQVKKGITSFHFSEETWKNPFMLQPGMEQQNANILRIGWDLIIDIDCAVLEYSKIAAHLITQTLYHLGIQSVTTKFSGNKGFHIAVPFESFPSTFQSQPTQHLFPEAPRKIAEYIKSFIEPSQPSKESLSQKILDFEQNQLQTKDINKILESIQNKTSTSFEELTVSSSSNQSLRQFSAFKILEIDTILISSRHLVRHVYSINEKSGLVSIPINPGKVLEFNKDIAKVENFVKSKFNFLERENIPKDEALPLLEKAYAHHTLQEHILTHDINPESEQAHKEYKQVTDKVPEALFPPSIKQILEGVKDGRKRAVFVLINFLRSMNWTIPEIEQRIKEWNQKNPQPLKQIFYKPQIQSNIGKKAQLPPNLDNDAYYKDFGVDTSKEISLGYKNPVTYALRNFRRNRSSTQPKEQLTEQQKEARRQHRKKKKQQKEDTSQKNQSVVL